MNLAIGLILGLLSSFLNIGGGPFNLIVLSYFFSMDSKTAALNSLYIILFSQVANLISTFIQGEIPSIKWGMLISMMISGAIGGYVGRRIAKHIDNEKTDRLFFVLLGIIVLLGIYNIVQYATC